jgi:hypothetical protein
MSRCVRAAIVDSDLHVCLGEMTSARCEESVCDGVRRDIGNVVHRVTYWGRIIFITRHQVRESIISIGEAENGSGVGP